MSGEQGKKGFYVANTDEVSKGLHLPGISDDARLALSQCLEDNHKRHHIFFNDKGFHNHLAHHLLAAFSLGATPDRLRTIHAQHASYQLPMRSTHEGFNPAAHWGDEDYYHDYLDFFTREIEEQDGGDARHTLERWLFAEEVGQQGQFYARFLSGAYHPFIHLGYGLEFDLNCMIAEGLAQTAVHKPQVAKLLCDGPLPSGGGASAKEVALKVAQENELEGKVKFEDGLKMNALLERGGGPIVRSHADRWSCPLDQLDEKAHELQQFAIGVMGAAVRPEKQIKFDFFLMHAVTSSIFLPVFVRFLRPENAARVLRDKLAVDLAYFVSRGRPQLHFDQLATYKHSQVDGRENGWLGIWDATLDSDKYDDEHVIKTVRALAYADLHHRDLGFLQRGTYLSVARMVVDSVHAVNDWDRSGVGFEQQWKTWPDRQ